MSDKPAASAAREMRKSVRKVLLSRAIFVSEKLRLKSAVTIDISTGGISLTVPDPLEIGQACAISFDVPGHQSKQRTLIRGTIASCVGKKEGGYRVGVFYVEPDPISKELIQAAIDGHLDQMQKKDAPIVAHACGNFDVKLTPQPLANVGTDSLLGRMLIDKTFEGDLQASSFGEMLTARTDVSGSAGYVAIERVSGSLHGRNGSFTLQHSGTMTRGLPQLSLTVVPDSATDELLGLAGNMTITIVEGKHSYEFAYTLALPITE